VLQPISVIQNDVFDILREHLPYGYYKMKTNQLLLIGGGAAIALYLVWERKESFGDDENKDFREGFTAGFFTPGPFTILGLAGAVAWAS